MNSIIWLSFGFVAGMFPGTYLAQHALGRATKALSDAEVVNRAEQIMREAFGNAMLDEAKRKIAERNA